jgi:hypothetical protein
LLGYSSSGGKAPSTWGGEDISRWHDAQVRGHLGHGVEATLHLSDLLNVPDVLGLVEAAQNVLDDLAVVEPLLKQGLGGHLLSLNGLHRLDGALAAWGGLSLRDFSLPLAALGLLAGSRGGRTAGTTVVTVNALHVVAEVPLAGESISGSGAVATKVAAQERLVTVAVETVGLTLMTEKAGGRRESSTLARLGLAAVGLEVRVDEPVVVALELFGLVVAARLALPGAVKQTISLGHGVLVERVVPSRLSLVALSARCEGRRE